MKVNVAGSSYDLTIMMVFHVIKRAILQIGNHFHRAIFIGYVTLTAFQMSEAVGQNYALEFNGVDSQIDLSFRPLQEEWTVSAWIKKEGAWAEDEVIIGSGWVTVQEWEDYPLHFSRGKLCAYRTQLFAPDVLPAGWHHIASSWDGKTTRLFIDGKEVAKLKGGRPICPAFMGSDDGKEFFKGQIDEVRIWNKAIPENRIKQWMSKAVTSAHPNYDSLLAYYRFDDRAKDATDYKSEHKADIKKHYKSKLPGDGPQYVLNENVGLQMESHKMKILYAQALKTSFPLAVGQKNIEVLKLKINCEGSKDRRRINAIDLDLSKTSNINSIERIRLWSLGPNAELDGGVELVKGGLAPGKQMTVELDCSLEEGINYIAVCVDLKSTAKPGAAINVTCSKLRCGNTTVDVMPKGSIGLRVIRSTQNNINELKVLNWNIWHGGIEKGKDLGPKQIAEIIKATDADIVTMVETYGSGQKIADMLGYQFYQPSKGANLSILSRYPILETYKSGKSDFFCVGAKVKLPNEREVKLWSIWIRYWGADYTLQQYSKKYTAKDWIQGDLETSYKDLSEILEKDIRKHDDGTTPLIFAGDFNSCSHLDFTEGAAKAGLHNGWVVDMPTHKLMHEAEFKDSYREIHPDESKDHGGTWAANYRWSDDFRIDYIYYKGPGIKALSSEVISHHPQADVLWPGDHSAVLSRFDVSVAK
ncbi:hypothetical protein NT6N_19070 [Oceaniferula spumae]|uniref:LamG-like jellyroll fold domain-containing protein n=1 Tax=Oceaniferula spumae TaxID=2979115 RepID=A0AAT9FLN8_9BACT